jgi:hypothetical protein
MAMTKRSLQEQERRYAAHHQALRAETSEVLIDESGAPFIDTCAYAGICSELELPRCACEISV